ncbi:DUF5412 domain-containing protein [Bacillus sp. EB600]|nr:DUF5412 domain-containing protein [Bacillus sp. EB600]
MQLIEKTNEVSQVNKKKLIIVGLVLIFIPLVIWISYHIYMTFFAGPTLNYLPKGELIKSVDSPNKQYTLKAYVSSGGATTDFAIRGELNFNKDDKNPKNIYWNYHEETAKIKWVDNDTVVINGHKLDVPDKTFDFRQN